MFRCRYIRLTASLALLVMACVFASEASAKQKHNKPPKYLNSPHCQKHQIGLIGVTNAEKAFNFFLRKGLTPFQSAALVGNLMQETAGINPHRVNYLGALGIGQWLYGRKTGLFQFAASKKESVYHLKTQLQYIWYEFMHSESYAYHGLRSQKSLWGATYWVRKKYERAADFEGMDSTRYAYAKSVWTQAKAVNFCGRWQYHAPAPHKHHASQPVHHKKKSKIQKFLKDPVGALIDYSGQGLKQGLKLAAYYVINQTLQSRFLQVAFFCLLILGYLKVRKWWLSICKFFRTFLRPQPEES